MSIATDLTRTTEDSLTIGNGTPGVKALVFDDGFTQEIRADPTANRIVTLQDRSGAIALNDDVVKKSEIVSRLGIIVNHTGTLTETTISALTVNFAANELVLGDVLAFKALLQVTNNTRNKFCRIRVNGTLLLESTNQGQAGRNFDKFYTVIQDGSSVKLMATAGSDDSGTNFTDGALIVNLAQAMTITTTFQLADVTDSMSLRAGFWRKL